MQKPDSVFEVSSEYSYYSESCHGSSNCSHDHTGDVPYNRKKKGPGENYGAPFEVSMAMPDEPVSKNGSQANQQDFFEGGEEATTTNKKHKKRKVHKAS